MSKRMTNLLLTLLAAALLVGFAFAVPNGSLTEEADEYYHDLHRENNEDDSWLWNIGSTAMGKVNV